MKIYKKPESRLAYFFPRHNVLATSPSMGIRDLEEDNDDSNFFNN